MLYFFIRGLGRLIFCLLGLKSRGLHNVPKQGAFIVASNHVGSWDPIVIAIVLNRQIHFMAKVELFNYVLLGKLLKKLGAFPVKRGSADKNAIKQAIYILEEDKVVGIFPEGTRNRTNTNLKPQLGVAMIALKTGVPILPVACLGTKSKLPVGWLTPLEVRIGKCIDLNQFKGNKVNSKVMAQVSDLVTDEINQLLQD